MIILLTNTISAPFFTVTTAMHTRDPPLLTPLLSAQARNHAFTLHRGVCVNFSEPGYFLKNCGAGWRNAFQLLNPVIGLNHDGGRMFKRWQQRIHSYRPHKHYSRNDPPLSERQYEYRRGSYGYTHTHHQHSPEQAQQVITAQSLLQPQSATHFSATRTNTASTSFRRYGPSYSANTNRNSRIPGTINAPPTQP